MFQRCDEQEPSWYAIIHGIVWVIKFETSSSWSWKIEDLRGEREEYHKRKNLVLARLWVGGEWILSSWQEYVLDKAYGSPPCLLQFQTTGSLLFALPRPNPGMKK